MSRRATSRAATPKLLKKRRAVIAATRSLRAAGLVHWQEGKDYVVADGDVILFRFNV